MGIFMSANVGLKKKQNLVSVVRHTNDDTRNGCEKTPNNPKGLGRPKFTYTGI